MQEFRDTSSFPKGILVIFIFQFIFFLFYSLSKEEKNTNLLYISLVIAIIGIFIAIAKVKFYINTNYMKFGLFPLPNNKLLLTNIDELKIIEVSPFSDFLGMGLRHSRKYGKGYITDCKYALFIKTISNKKITISIKDIEGLKMFLEKNNISNKLSNLGVNN